MDRRTWWLLLMTLLVSALALSLACGDDDDDDDNVAADDDTVGDDDDDDDDDDDNDDSSVDDDDDDNDDTPEEPWPGAPWFGCTDEDEPAAATVVTAFDQVDQYFNSGDDDKRTVDAVADFPATTDWSRVTMRVELECPADGDCDNWDRFANLALVLGAGTPDEQILELWRYITPYNIGMCMLADVTAFAPMLTGEQTLRSFIDTWVGPENQPQHGHGWRVTVKFIFHPGAKADDVPDHIFNVWPYASIEVGNPDNPIAGQIGDQQAALPATISRADLRLIVTGHGQGNLDNCAEFCHLDQVVLVNGEPFRHDPWRSDCPFNPIGPDQAGTWKYQRAGWCPGAAVAPHVFDVTAELTADTGNDFAYQVWRHEEDALYENTCRPGAGDVDNFCEGCAFDQNPGNCDYDGGMHTSPTDRIAVQLFVWE
jgi:Peptide-N-glycosidase F, C terminal